MIGSLEHRVIRPLRPSHDSMPKRALVHVSFDRSTPLPFFGLVRDSEILSLYIFELTEIFADFCFCFLNQISREPGYFPKVSFNTQSGDSAAFGKPPNEGLCERTIGYVMYHLGTHL